MAVVAGERIVSGTSGWGDSDVLDKLEEVFADLKLHGGTPKYGVPTFCSPPGCSDTTQYQCNTYDSSSAGSLAWRKCGGENADRTQFQRTFDAYAKTGNTKWQITEYWQPTGASASANTLTVPANAVLETGKAVVWCPNQSDNNYNIDLLTLGETYYIIRVDETTVQLATSFANATATPAVPKTIGGNTPVGGSWSANTRLYDPVNASTENPTIKAEVGDNLTFNFPNSDATSFKVYQQDLVGGDSLDSTKEFTHTNHGTLDYETYSNTSTYYPSYNGSTTYTFNSHRGFKQTDYIKTSRYPMSSGTFELSVDKPSHMGQGGTHDASGYGTNDTKVDLGWYGNKKCVYNYIHSAYPAMVGEIELVGKTNSSNNTSYHPFWDIKIPASVGGGNNKGALDLYLRVTRWKKYYGTSGVKGYVKSIEVINVASSSTNPYNSGSGLDGGWGGDGNAVTFTISGADTGGVATTNDIVFGANTDETSSGSEDGKPSLQFTNFGGSSDNKFFIKSNNGRFAVLRVVNDASKKYGTTFYSFVLCQNTTGGKNNVMYVNSGTYYEVMNSHGVNADYTATSNNNYSYQYGYWCGVVGEERQADPWSGGYSGNDSSYSYQGAGGTNDYRRGGWYQYARQANPTDAALKIKWWRGNAAANQDSNFAIISFVQTEGTSPVAWFTFSLPAKRIDNNAGDNAFMTPNPGIDYDQLYNGSITTWQHRRFANGYTQSDGVDYDDLLEVETRALGYDYYNWSPGFAPKEESSKTREAIYGYIRNTNISDGDRSWDSSGSAANYMWEPNINKRNPKLGSYDGNYQTAGHIYYRNGTYDGTAASSDWYRPVKGIPINPNLIPCPYYLPDDFVLIQVGSTPGTTHYRSGDTITVVSGVEIYTIIYACYDRLEDGADMGTDNIVTGMLLCARTT